MLTALKDLGSFLLSKNQKSTIDILLENPDSNGTYKVVWALEFDDQLTYKDVSVEELKDPKLYLYKRATGSNAPDFSPTSRVTEPSKTFTKKILQWFKNHTEITEIKKMYEELDANRDRILERLNELNAQTKDNKIITIKIGDKYLYEIDNPDFRKILRDDFLSKIQEISKANAQCSICGEKKDKVFTTSAIYKFYTLDKECYISGGFIKKEAWKNFPICEECFLQIDFAKKYVEEHLQFNFSGKTYYLIPKMVLKSAEAFDTLSEILEILTSEEKKQRLTNEQRKIITGDKNEILSILQDYNDVVSFYFLFLKRDHSAERILLLIEDVFPSRIHFIFDAKGKIDKIFRNNYTFAKLTQFLNEFDKLFFEVIDKIFRGGKLDFKILLQIFNRKIREAFLGDDDMKFFYIVTDALLNIRFFEELGLLNNGDTSMESSKFQEIYEKFGRSLNSPAKRGIFLLGALTQMLLNIQSQERESAPFFKNLKGLKMNEEDIKGLLPKVINKLMEYDRFDRGKKELVKEISTNLLAEDKFRLNIDEINFYFAAGMALSKEVANFLYAQKVEGESVTEIEE